jgi:hypothetical protein
LFFTDSHPPNDCRLSSRFPPYKDFHFLSFELFPSTIHKRIALLLGVVQVYGVIELGADKFLTSIGLVEQGKILSLKV